MVAVAPEAFVAEFTGRNAVMSRTALLGDFETLYQTHFARVWRSLQRFGVPEEQLDDAAQEVFIVLLRRRDDFEGRSSVETWIYGVAFNVAQNARRARRRSPAVEPIQDGLAAEQLSPAEAAIVSQQRRVLAHLLDQLDDDKRAVFVLAELEQRAAPEIAEILSVKLNTVYSRLRAARAQFALAVTQYQEQASHG